LSSEAGREAGPLRSTKIMETESLSRAQGSMFATPGLDPGGATREAGATKGRPKGRPSFDGLWTPSTDQAGGPGDFEYCDYCIYCGSAI